MATIVLWLILNALAVVLIVRLHTGGLRWRRQPPTPAEVPPAQARADMIFIWTEIHGIPRARAEAMWEEYERASAVASLGLKGK